MKAYLDHIWCNFYIHITLCFDHICHKIDWYLYQFLSFYQYFSFIIKSIEEFVQNDYVIAYFHQGMRDTNKPSLQFLWNAYKELDRSFKKNLKKLYVVHPTTFIRMVWFFFKPIISEKFKNKLIYTSSLDELIDYLGLKVRTLNVPDTVKE